MLTFYVYFHEFKTPKTIMFYLKYFSTSTQKANQFLPSWILEICFDNLTLKSSIKKFPGLNYVFRWKSSSVAMRCFSSVFLYFKLNFCHTAKAPIGENIIEDWSSETPCKGLKNICLTNSNFYIFEFLGRLNFAA